MAKRTVLPVIAALGIVVVSGTVAPQSSVAHEFFVPIQATSESSPPDAAPSPKENETVPGKPLAGGSQPEKAKKDGSRVASEPKLDPKNPEHRAKLLSELYAKLKASKTKEEAKRHQGSIERLWLRSGSSTVDLLMRRSTVALGQRKKKLATQLLDKVVDLDPKYVEGWNRRAFLAFADKRFGDALVDLQHVLAIDPNHFKAVEGLVSLMEQVGDKKGQLEALKILLSIHPFWPKAEKVMETLRREVEGQPL